MSREAHVRICGGRRLRCLRLPGHRMFSYVSLNWRGKPLESLEVIINLIAATTSSTGLKVYAQLDERKYEKGVEVTDEQLDSVNITRDSFHGDWNYTITPSLTES